MLRVIAFMLLVAATVSVAVKELSLPTSGVSIDLLEVMANDFRVREKTAQHRQFRYLFDSTLEYLVKGDIHLSAAAARVRLAGEAFSPDFIRLVPKAEGGKSLNESLARNLLNHVRMRSRRNPSILPQVAHLEVELQDMIAEPDRETNGQYDLGLPSMSAGPQE